MPSPFPGMNPYMEDPRQWTGVHNRFLNFLELEIVSVLPEGFYTRFEERVVIQDWNQSYLPDGMIIQGQPVESSGGVAVAEKPEVTESVRRILDFGADEIRQPFLEIYSLFDGEELVTVIELLSPTNKDGGAGEEDYRRKQRDLMQSMVSLVEIDLLREGNYVLAPPEAGTRRRLGPFDYLVSVHRGGTGRVFETYPVRLRDRLPKIEIPLTREVGDLTVDLQKTLDTMYDAVQFRRKVRYDVDPVPHLSSDDMAWADALLREKGLR